MEYQEYRDPLAVPACAEPLPQLTAAAVGSPWQVPRSQPDVLAVALGLAVVALMAFALAMPG